MTDRERRRLQELRRREEAVLAGPYRCVAGLDEAGRGCLAGPVVAAAVVMPAGSLVEGVNDSKKLTPVRREKVFEALRETAVACGVGLVYQEEIDRINIYQATIKAMKQAVASLAVSPDYLMIDGMRLPGCSLVQEKIVSGDAYCYSIAAASIVAKVTRDRLMLEFDKAYPGYGFARHKGYGTREHMEALRKHSPCGLHRKTFRPVSGFYHAER